MNEQIIPLFTRSTLIFTLKKKKTKKQIKVLKDEFYVSKEKRIKKKKETNKRLLVKNRYLLISFFKKY